MKRLWFFSDIFLMVYHTFKKKTFQSCQDADLVLSTEQSSPHYPSFRTIKNVDYSGSKQFIMTLQNEEQREISCHYLPQINLKISDHDERIQIQSSLASKKHSREISHLVAGERSSLQKTAKLTSKRGSQNQEIGLLRNHHTGQHVQIMHKLSGTWLMRTRHSYGARVAPCR